MSIAARARCPGASCGIALPPAAAAGRRESVLEVEFGALDSGEVVRIAQVLGVLRTSRCASASSFAPGRVISPSNARRRPTRAQTRTALPRQAGGAPRTSGTRRVDSWAGAVLPRAVRSRHRGARARARHRARARAPTTPTSTSSSASTQSASLEEGVVKKATRSVQPGRRRARPRRRRAAATPTPTRSRSSASRSRRARRAYIADAAQRPPRSLSPRPRRRRRTTSTRVAAAAGRDAARRTTSRCSRRLDARGARRTTRASRTCSASSAIEQSVDPRRHAPTAAGGRRPAARAPERSRASPSAAASASRARTAAAGASRSQLLGDGRAERFAREAARQAIVEPRRRRRARRHDDRRARPGLARHPAARGDRPRPRGRLQPQGHVGLHRPHRHARRLRAVHRRRRRHHRRTAAARSTSTTRARPPRAPC